MKSDQPRSEKKEDYSSTRFYTAFALLAFFSCRGLDYIASKKGERSYVFSAAAPKTEIPEAPVSLAVDIVLGEILYMRDATYEAEYQLYIMKRAAELAPYERMKKNLILEMRK